MPVRPARILIVAAAAAAACDCGTEGLKKFSQNTVTIVSPVEGQVVVSNETVDYHATAHNPAGLEWLSLWVGDREMKACPAGESNDDIDCQTTFSSPDVAGQISQGELLLVARAKDIGGETAEASLRIRIKPLRIRFKAPVVNAQLDPPRAVVRGKSNMVLEVVSTLPVQQVQVGYDQSHTLARFTAPTSGNTYSKQIDWPTLGTGDHHLVAEAVDTDGSRDTDAIDIKVMCTADSQCPAGKRCCLDDGLCWDTVARGADCDCTHPCPMDQGCFPGTCGQTPRKCRPGCFPGDENRRMERCTPQDGRPAYCSDLPAAEATAENRGGACAPADSCDITRQNCPTLPLDRSRPANDTDNKPVTQKCVPSSPTTNVCMPAGPMGEGATNCDESCDVGALTTGCKKSYLCVQTVGPPPDYTPRGPPHCSQLCPDPNPLFPNRSTCPAGQYCTTLMGSGHEDYSVGACSTLGL